MVHTGPNRRTGVIEGEEKAYRTVVAGRGWVGAWARSGAPRGLTAPNPPLQERAVREAIPMPDKSEVALYYGFAGQLARKDPDFYAAQLMNTVLGGGSGLVSRLARRVRDQQGLVYGIYSYFDSGH